MGEVHGVVEAADQADHLELARPLDQLRRGDALAENPAVLADAVRALELPDHPGIAYLAGEARTILEPAEDPRHRTRLGPARHTHQTFLDARPLRHGVIVEHGWITDAHL